MRNNEWIITIMEEKIEGKTGTNFGRPKIPFIKLIIVDIGKISYGELKVVMVERKDWSSI